MMDPNYLTYISYTRADTPPDSPQITLEVTSILTELSLTLPYPLDYKLRRLETDTTGPFIFEWSLFKHALRDARLILFRITEDGPQRVEIRPLTYVNSDPETITVHGWNHHLWDISPSGSDGARDTLTANYQRHLIAGQKYVLLWPGAEISLWDWGSMEDHLGKELAPQNLRENKLPPLILPAAVVATFTTKTEPSPWPDRPATTSDWEFQDANQKEQNWRQVEHHRQHPPQVPPLRSKSERVPGAPILSIELECPTEWKPDDRIDMLVKVTYEPNPSAEPSSLKPIIFHTRPFTYRVSGDEFYLYQLINNTWKEVQLPDEESGFGIFDDPPIPVMVGQKDGKYSEEFATLMPGETWTTQRTVQNGRSWSNLPYDVQVGDRFRYVFRGTEVDWWDWGTTEDHRDTEVKLPCWIAGDVEEPADNDGRPKLIVPASNEVDFVYVG